MPDTKISALTSLSAPDNADVLPIVDTSATQTKKISWSAILTALHTIFDIAFVTVPTAAAIVWQDLNKNYSANNFLASRQSTSASSGSTSLTVASSYYQYLTGAVPHTFVLPDTTTLQLGHSFKIVNRSTGLLTIHDHNGDPVCKILSNTWAYLTCVSLSGASPGDWDPVVYSIFVLDGKKPIFLNNITFRGTDSTDITFPDHNSTLQTTDNLDTDSTFAANSDTKYPSQKAVKTGLAAKQNSLGYTAEDESNKDTDSTFAANSDTKYPSQKSVKTALALKVPTSRTVNGHALSGDINVTAGDLSLGNVDNTSDATKNAATADLTNKRVVPRVTTVTSSATPTPNADTTDVFSVSAAAVGMTIGAPTGTPVDGQILTVRIKDNGTARSIAWNAIYRVGIDDQLTNTTVISKWQYEVFIYNFADTKWDLINRQRSF